MKVVVNFQSRAKQLYNAGYKTLQSIAKANVDDLVESIEFMSKRVANQLIAASKVTIYFYYINQIYE